MAKVIARRIGQGLNRPRLRTPLARSYAPFPTAAVSSNRNSASAICCLCTGFHSINHKERRFISNNNRPSEISSLSSPMFKIVSRSTVTLTTKNYNMTSKQSAPCSVGDPVSTIETPALLLCLEKFESNLQCMTKLLKTSYPQVTLRPHGKAHKCPDIAKEQIKLGAVGICCQTLSEAEAMAAGGVKDIFISNQVIGASKLERIACLAKDTRLSLCVDDERNVDDLDSAAQQHGVTLDIVIEVDVGGQRCGVEPGPEVVKLAKKIQDSSGLTFKGLHCYNGINQHVRLMEDRKKAVDGVIEKVKKALAALQDAGIECNYVTGGGTGTFHFEAESGVYTELQCGSYIFMDVDYRRNLDKDEKPVSEFDQSLYVLSTVQSAKDQQRAVLDAGMKALSMDSGPPQLRGSEESQVYINAGDEHGLVVPRGDLQIGDQIWLAPGHCDPTVNMHDWIIGLRNGHVECVWPITGRGPGI